MAGGGRDTDYNEVWDMSPLVVEKDRVIAEVRGSFAECTAKLAALEALVGINTELPPPRRFSAPDH